MGYVVRASDAKLFPESEDGVINVCDRPTLEQAMWRAKQMLKNYPDIEEVYIVDYNGNVIASSIAHMYVMATKPQAINL